MPLSMLATDHVFTATSATAHVGHRLGTCAHAGYLNDLFAFSTDSNTWSYLSATVLGSPPSSRFGHAAASTGDFLYMTGGIALSGA